MKKHRAEMEHYELVEKLVKAERENQDKQWGEQNHDDYIWLAILQEEVGEAAKALLEKKEVDFFYEMIQVTAVGHAILEAIMRRNM